MRMFIHNVAVLDKLVWKCTMNNHEIHDVIDSMNAWLIDNVGLNYQWYTPDYAHGAPQVEHNGEKFFTCICFEYENDLNKFREYFGCIR